MSERFEISAGERGVVRLFAVDLPPEQIEAFAEPDYEANADDPPWPLKDALGAEHLDADFIELFPIGDLKGVGLPGYMTEGLGIAEKDVKADRARLEAMGGHVLIVLSAAFGGVEQTIKPRAPLRWIGTYVEESAPVQFRPLPSESATGEVNTAGAKRPSDAAISGRVAIAVLIFLAVLVGLMVWIAG